MPLAWFSRAECEVYHVCLNCGYMDEINDTNLSIRSVRFVEDMTSLKLCQNCERLMDDGLCETSLSKRFIGKTIAQLGRVRRFPR